ncbi:alcohol oxidase [Pluteus cervinus]|uniref:Alcohol oxidase n=1 Tax=Pluteus cervinus TaxID=181527 RepID=A0ACD3AX61_9AGAR|nr:alcohol oxidase [Pluteus cervinus]
MSSTTYDIIFAGELLTIFINPGGTAACVTAGRLAAAAPSLRILIVEAGPHTRDVKQYSQPGRYLRNLLGGSEAFTFHQAKPSPALAGRSLIIPSGRCLGGGSSINFMMYTRASASDYDDWERIYENQGWGSEDIIPLLKKAETYQVNPHDAVHGASGPMKISFEEKYINIGDNFLQVAAAYDTKRPATHDVNGFFSCNAYGRWPRYIDGETGKRSDAAHGYIYSQSENKNLVVQDRCRVVRVIIQDGVAVGVEYVDDKVGRAKGTPEHHVVYASKLVVVSAGAFGSAAILESKAKLVPRSGIGSAEVLEKNGIAQIVDLPGVGENYLDHNLGAPLYIANEDADSINGLFRDTEAEIQVYEDEWLRGEKGLMTHNGVDAGIKLRPDEGDIQAMGPAFKKRWEDYFANAPDKPVAWLGTFAAYPGGDPRVPRGKYFSAAYYLEYPVSTGRVHITGGLNPYAVSDFEPGAADIEVLRWVYKKGRELARRMKYYRGEFAIAHPQFPKDSDAKTQPVDGPVNISAPDIVYSKVDDEAIDAYHRQTIETTWHSMGTCAMKPREQGGVVDSRLNVYGIQGLKVADLSIGPANVGANTCNTAIAIGEKAAVIIAEELGISGV